MEKTLARAIYKAMEIGKRYTTKDIRNLLGDSYYLYVSYVDWKTQTNGKSEMETVSSALWEIVKSGYGTTNAETQKLPNVRGLKYGAEPKSHTEYTFRYWARVK